MAGSICSPGIFLENKGKGVHLEATDELIIEALSEPDHTQPPEGNRTVYWKKIRSRREWWLKVVIADEDSGLQVLSAYENSQKGAKLWRCSEAGHRLLGGWRPIVHLDPYRPYQKRRPNRNDGT